MAMHVKRSCRYAQQDAERLSFLLQELLELTDTDVASRVRSKKTAAKLSREVQHLQSTWLQVTCPV